jgi:hypothetical protein
LPAGEEFVVPRPDVAFGAGPVPSIMQPAAMKSTSFSGARSRQAAPVGVVADASQFVV